MRDPEYNARRWRPAHAAWAIKELNVGLDNRSVDPRTAAGYLWTVATDNRRTPNLSFDDWTVLDRWLVKAGLSTPSKPTPRPGYLRVVGEQEVAPEMLQEICDGSGQRAKPGTVAADKRSGECPGCGQSEHLAPSGAIYAHRVVLARRGSEVPV